MKSSRELSDAQLRKLLALALRHRGYYLRLWDRCRAHGLGPDDDLARHACEAWNALARYAGALEDGSGSRSPTVRLRTRGARRCWRHGGRFGRISRTRHGSGSKTTTATRRQILPRSGAVRGRRAAFGAPAGR